MIIKFRDAGGILQAAVAQEQIKKIVPILGGSRVIYVQTDGSQAYIDTANLIDDATNIINKQGPVTEIAYVSQGSDAISPPPNNAQPTFPPEYYATYNEAVALGLVPGVQVTPFYWRANNVSTAADTIIYPYADVTPGAGLLSPITGNTILSIESTSANDDGVIAGSGAQTFQINGVQIDGTSVSETVTLTGTTPVLTTTPFFRVQDASVQTYGSGGTNEGRIIIKDNATGFTYYAMNETDGNMTGSFTPAANKALINWQATYSATSQFVEITMWLRYAAFETGRRKVAIFNATPAPNTIKSVVTGGLPQGIEIFATARHTRPLAPGETYDVYMNLEAYTLQL